ncbi:MAG: hypothetical protein ACXQTV_03580 [Candidatus Hecatellaceae archaeon]
MKQAFKSRLRRLGLLCWAAGSILMLEKILNYGAIYTYPPHFFDHGLYGLILVAVGFILLAKKEKG